MPEDDVRGRRKRGSSSSTPRCATASSRPGATLTADEKLEVADALVELGRRRHGGGFPAASPGDFEAVRAIANRVKGVTVAGLARCNESDIERAAMAVKGAESPRIHTFIATSDIHLKHKLRMSRPEVLERVDRMVGSPRGSPETSSSPPKTRPAPIGSSWRRSSARRSRRARRRSTSRIRSATPRPLEYAALMEYLIANVPGVERAIISVHCHDDLGMATANTLAAVRGRGAAGRSHHEWHRRARRQHLAGRSGHGAGDARRSVRGRHDPHPQGAPGADQPAGQHADRRPRCSRTRPSSARTRSPMRPASTRTGCSRSGRPTRSWNPTDVGWEGTRAGPRQALRPGRVPQHAAEIGIRLDEDQLNEAYQRFLALADRKKTVTAADLVALVSDQLEVADDPLQLVRWNASIGSGGPATGSQVVSRWGAEISGDGQGNGAVNALFQAIDAAVAIPASSRSTTSRRSRPARTPRGRCDCGSAPATRSSPARTRHRRHRGERAGVPGGAEQSHRGDATAMIAGPVSAVSRWT